MREEKGSSLGCGCMPSLSIGCLSIFAFVFFAIYIFLAKPESVWGNIVDFLNAGLEVSDPAISTSASEVNDKINSQIELGKGGKVQIRLLENELTSLARENLKDFKNAQVDIEDNVLSIYWELDSTIEGNPLYGVISVKDVDGETQSLERVGTKRIGFPKFVNQIIANSALKALGKEESQSGSSLLVEIINMNDSYTVNKIRISGDEVVINATLNTDIV